MSPAYFDTLVERFEHDKEAEKAFGQHIHWGYWENPKNAGQTLEEFTDAQKALSFKHFEFAQIMPGMSILDAGCGFGGSIRLLDKLNSDINLYGINIDTKQVEYAKSITKSRDSNTINFFNGDACDLPFEDNSFDIVFAIECIFAFPDKSKFYSEVFRVLKPGGKLIISDFLPPNFLFWAWKVIEDLTKKIIGRTYGKFSVSFDSIEGYKSLGKRFGLKLEGRLDITKNTIPTYPIVNKLMQKGEGKEMIYSTKALELLSRFGILKYTILFFQKDS